ncbi:hypothetical protein [Bradyrhizobium sp. CCBAU 53338]|nr:hypothetical protein [Bradyrhizobium sp. CCBAU 53338]
MEPQHRNEARKPDRQQAERSASSAEHAAVNPAFASEGLEQVRDSHC